MEKIRINKYLSKIGYCSRRAADKLIDAGRITVNGVEPEMGLKVGDSDEIKVDGELISTTTDEVKKVYLVFNKPQGIVCTTDSGVEKDNIVDYINYPVRIYPVGRLDKRSEGLIIMTNDGEIVNHILRARNHHDKEYEVTVDQPVTDEFIQKMANGVPILDTITRKCEVKKLSTYKFSIVLTQGLNRQIRRMCEYFDYRVIKLKRTRIMDIELDLPVGKYRELTNEEIQSLKK